MAGRVLGLLADRGLSCPLPPVVEEPRKDEEKQNALMGAHERTKAKTENREMKAYLGGGGRLERLLWTSDLRSRSTSSSLGVLQKNSDGTYTAGNGYTLCK